LRARRPAIAHCHTPKAGLLGGLAARLAGVPVIFYTVRGLPHLTARGLLRALLIGTERLACRFAHRVIAVSPSVRDELLRLRACAPEKLSVPGPGSAQGVDAEGRFNPQRAAGLPSVRAELGLPAGALVLGFVGRLVRDKGFTELWQAWTVLRERHPDLHLLIAGADREPRAGVRQEELDACRADPRVRLVGVVEDIERHYAAMDVFAFPSHREGFSNAVLEAAAMALPVVRDGVRDGETGRLAPLSDGGRFTALLEELILDPAARARLGANARAWMLRDFRPEDRLRQVEASYREALTQAGIPLPQAEPVA
jgi:glycosyltransferase involved in cell wall biosynthesis